MISNHILHLLGFVVDPNITLKKSVIDHRSVALALYKACKTNKPDSFAKMLSETTPYRHTINSHIIDKRTAHAILYLLGFNKTFYERLERRNYLYLINEDLILQTIRSIKKPEEFATKLYQNYYNTIKEFDKISHYLPF